MDSLPEQILVDIIRQEMELDQNSVWIRDQNKDIPADNGLYVVVGLSDSIPISSANSFDSVAMTEIQQVIVCENIQIDIFSRSKDLISRRWEVMAALHSVLSRQAQEANNFKIFKMPKSFVNASSAEGGSNINRYTMTFACHVWYRKEKVLQSPNGDYYDDFTQEVDDEASIIADTEIIEFEIK
jgi:hypothetical protein